MMNLLAKPNESLIQHTENTLKVFSSIKTSYPDVPEICDVPDFWEHLFYSLFLHDFGKAASGFQDYLKGGSPWKYRHEILSSLFILSLNEIYDESTIHAIGLCVITHHKDIKELSSYDTFSNVNRESYFEKLNELQINFKQLTEYLQLIPKFSQKYLGYKLNIPLKMNFGSLMDFDPFEEIVYDFEDDVDENNYNKIQGTYGLFLKGFMNACDYLASGGHYEILNAVENKKLFDFESYRTTQELASKTKGSTFLIAPTGSGKTEASLLWADYNQNTKFSKRIFYMLPYTASINAMYNRLTKLLENEELVGLSHGKASYFISCTET